MARVRFIGAEPVTVPELGGRRIEPDEMVEVPDGRFGGYICQTGTWESIEEPRDWVWPEEEEEAQAASESATRVAPAPPVERQSTPKKTTAVKAAPAVKEG